MTSTTYSKSDNGIGRLVARMRSQLRRVIAMAGAPYVDGPMSPL